MTENNNLSILNGKTLEDVYPEGTNWDIPIDKITLTELFDRAVNKYADKPCIDFLGTRISYSEMAELVDKAAKGFQELGVQKGTKVGLYMPNTHWYPILFFGAMKAGATVVNFSSQYLENELEDQIKDSGTEIMVTADSPKPDTFGSTVSQLKKNNLKQILVLNLADTLGPDKSWMPTKLKYGLPIIKIINRLKTFFNFSVKENITNLNKFIDNDGQYHKVETDPDEVAVLQYTGGTSGTPKGAELTHDNLSANAQQITEFIKKSESKPDSPYLMQEGGSGMFAPLPNFHIFGMTASMITTLHMGMETVMVMDPRDIETSMKIIDRTKPDCILAVPNLGKAMVSSEHIENYDITSLKGMVTGGSATPPAVKNLIEEKTNMRVKPGYGASETSPVLTITPLYGHEIEGSAGVPVPGVELRICDPSDPNKILEYGMDGEIQACGRNIMKGYYNNPEETEATIITEADGKKWYRTGDIGHFDTGQLIITDRIKRMIVLGDSGKKASATKIENALMEHPDINECVVIAINKGTEKESGKALIKFEDGKDVSPEDLKEFLSKVLNKYEIPRHYETVTEPFERTVKGEIKWAEIEKNEAEKANKQAKEASPQPPHMAP